MSALLEIRDLRTYFYSDGAVARAVDGVSFSIGARETLGLVGESGCGKSVCSLSILRVLQEPPAKIVSGEMLFEGKDLRGLNERQMRKIRGNRIAMIFQEPRTAFNPLYTIGYQVCEALHAHRKISKQDAKAQCVDLFAKVGIPAAQERFHSYPHQLSGGLCQRAMIAMALALRPALLIADEATTALDVTIQGQILDLLAKLREEYHMAMLLISHDMGVIASMADRVAVMYAGQIVEMAPTREIFASPQHPYTQGLLQSVPRLGVSQSLKPIAGTVPTATAKPSGCTFHPRCPIKEARCEKEEQTLRETKPGHFVACWKR